MAPKRKPGMGRWVRVMVGLDWLPASSPFSIMAIKRRRETLTKKQKDATLEKK